MSVAEIGAAAEVAEKTVYNYFPSKAEIVFDEGDDLCTELLHAVRQRRPGESALAALANFIAGMDEWAAHRRPTRPGVAFRQLIADSPALQAHRRLMFARYETELATLLAEQTDAVVGAAEPFVAAVALIGVLRAAFEAGNGHTPHHDTVDGLHLLAAGLDHYARAPQPSPRAAPGARDESGGCVR